jgi:photosystem II stability/assembly factor-like uncharacterized protein
MKNCHKMTAILNVCIAFLTVALSGYAIAQQPVPGLPSDCPSFTKEHVLPVFHSKIHGTDSQHVWAVDNSHGVSGFGIIRFFNGQKWQTQLPKATRHLNDIFSISTSVAWAVGDNGLVLATRNGGALWQSQVTPSASALYGVAAASKKDVWAVGANGTIIRTKDGGLFWGLQQSGTNSNLHAVAASSPSVAWAVGLSGTILRTSDGGSSWTALSSGTTVSLSEVLAISSWEAWVVGENGTILHTTNAGQNWRSVPGVTSEWLNSIGRDPGGRLLVVGNKGTILRYDGASWRRQAGGASRILGSVYAPTGIDAWIVSIDEYSLLLRGNPMAGLWSPQSEVTPLQIIWDVHGNLNNDTAWVTGSPGAILHTRDGGRTWRTLHLESDTQLLKVVATRSNHIWAAGFGGPRALPVQSIVMHYDGTSWTRHDTGANRLLSSVAAVSDKAVWAVGASNTIVHTSDGGRSWAQQRVPPTVPSNTDFLDVAASSTLEAWVVGTGGVILRTVNGGQTWVRQNTPATQDLRAVSISGNDVWIVGHGGMILHFDGLNWTSHTGVTTQQLNDVAATHASGIWIVGVNGTMLLYDGVRWYQPSTDETAPLASVSVVGTTTGIEVWVTASPLRGPNVLRFSCR